MRCAGSCILTPSLDRMIIPAVAGGLTPPSQVDSAKTCCCSSDIYLRVGKCALPGDGMKLLTIAIVFSLCSFVYAASNPVPLLNQPLVPSAVAPGSASFTLNVNGSGFISSSVVNWNGSARTTHFVSSLQVTADILSSDVAVASTASVNVFNPGPGGGTSNPQFLQVIASSTTLNFSKTDTTFSFTSILGQPVVATSKAPRGGDGHGYSGGRRRLGLPDASPDRHLYGDHAGSDHLEFRFTGSRHHQSTTNCHGYE
jgi:hypothetical protein